MKVAFHFNADADKYSGSYGTPIKKMFLRALLDADEKDVHLKIFCGELLAWKYVGDEAAREKTLEGLLGYDFRWKEFDRHEFAEALRSVRIYVLAVDGLTPQLRNHLHIKCKEDNSYLGAFEIWEGNPVHWVLYRKSLIPQFRFFERELRIFYRAFEEAEGADSRNFGLAEDMKTLPFSSVNWEDLGVRHTVFDAYDSPDHARRTAEVADFVSEHLSRLAADVLLRITDLSPQLTEILYSALRAFRAVETGEDVAQAATSCRRFVAGLADALYPPKDGLVDGREVGKTAYMNRLCAYAAAKLKERERKLVAVQLEDIDRRMHRVNDLANKGLHDNISRSDLQRLLIALVVLTYDLLSLAPPPLQVPMAPHGAEIDKSGKGMIKRLGPGREEGK
jgi:hypothetical protein